MQKIKLIYILGAGRSGTTILATVLGNADQITTLGEMHQFFDHLSGKKNCSCGKALSRCNQFWSEIYDQIPDQIKESINEINDFNIKMEKHKNIPLFILNIVNKNNFKRYIKVQEKIFHIIKDNVRTEYLLDSAKYIARGLLLNKSNEIEIKFIYVVRDVRGVANSFKKKVQTSKGPISSLLYYNLINIFGEIVYRLISKDKIKKIKYEDFVSDPIEQLCILEKYLNIDLGSIKHHILNNDYFIIPHIIGGNRIREKDRIKLVIEEKERKYGYINNLLYWLSFPLMKINKYGLR